MANSDVDIKITGDATGAQKAFKDAADAAQQAVGGISTAFEGLGGILDTLQGHLGAVLAVLAGGAFFKEAISATKEFVGDVTSLSKAAGISAQEASGLKVALEDIGSNAETYTGALAKLTRQVRTNEAGLNAMGIATRDSNGQFLDGRALMDSTITTLNSYKEGTDRNLAAQVAFGKGAAESAALLKLNTAIQEEGRKKAEELNLVIGPGTQAAVKAYKMAMNDVSDIMTGVQVTIGKEIIPILADLAQWFASAGPAAIAIFKPAAAGIGDVMRMVGETVKEVWQFFAEAFAGIGALFNDLSGQSLTFGDVVRNAFALIGIALLAMKELFQLSFEGIRVAVTSVIGVVRTFANVAAAAFARDWSGAKAAWKAGLADIETEVSESTKRIVKIRDDAAAAIEKLAMGEGYKRPEEPEAKKAAGTRSFTDPSAKTGKDGPTIMAQYEAELAAQKLAIDEKNALDGTFYAMSKQQEADFWQAKVATVDKGTKEYYQIEKKYVDARLALNKDQFEATLADLKKQEDGIKYDYDTKLNFAQRENELIRQKFGAQSKEYEAGLAAIQKLEQQKLEQSIKVNEQMAENRKTAALAGIDLEDQQAQLAVALMQKTDAQLLAEQTGFENRRYAIQVEALQERMRLASLERNPVEVEKINGQLEQLEIQHQARLRTIQGQAALQQAQFTRSVYGALQNGFSNMISGAIQGTLKMRDVMRQTFASIADALAQAITQMVAQWLIGELTKTATTKTESMVRIQEAAGEAAANAYNAIVGIPYVGPFLAPVAAAVAYAGVLAFAEDGYDVPAGVAPITQLHQKEMVLPAKHADVIRSLADGGGSGGAGGAPMTINISAMDGADVKRVLMRHGDAIVNSLRSQKRNFNPA